MPKDQPKAIAADFAVLVLYSPESSPCVGIRQPAPIAVHCADAFVQVAVSLILDQTNVAPPFNVQPVAVPIVPPVAVAV